jgi:hypothetical protein
MTMLGHQLLILGRIDLLVDQIQPLCTLVGQIQPACTFVDQQDTIFLAQDARLLQGGPAKIVRLAVTACSEISV